MIRLDELLFSLWIRWDRWFLGVVLFGLSGHDFVDDIEIRLIPRVEESAHDCFIVLFSGYHCGRSKLCYSSGGSTIPSCFIARKKSATSQHSASPRSSTR